MGNDQSSPDEEFQPTKVKVLLHRIKNLPLYTKLNGSKQAEVYVELSLGSSTFATHRVFASSTGEAILKKKYTFLLKEAPRSPLTIKVVDYKLGEIGRKELSWGCIPYYSRWDLYTPSLHWTFKPSGNQIETLGKTNTLQLPTLPCDLEFCAVVWRRKTTPPKAAVTVCPCIRLAPSLQLPQTKERFPLSSERLRRWTVLNSNLEELQTDTHAAIHKWSVGANQKKTNLDDIYDGFEPHDRRHANRQAFLRRQSQSISGAGALLDKSMHFPKLDLATIANLSMPDPNAQWMSVFAPDTHPLVESAEQRFINQQRSFTTIVRSANVGEHSGARTLLIWRSLPNVLMETDTKDHILSKLFNKTTNYYIDHYSSVPLITHIYPDRVPFSGGDTVTVTGQNFGTEGKEIAKFQVCGVDCTDVVQYVSNSKLRFITKPYIPGRGEVTLWTRSGQRSICQAVIEFYDPSAERDSGESSDRAGRIQASSLDRLRQYEAALEEDITTLIKNIVHHELHNDALKAYLVDLEKRTSTMHPNLFHEYQVDMDAMLHHHHHSSPHHRSHH